MTTDLHTTARRLRDLVEPIAAGVYFAPEAIEGYKAEGLDYFEGYFCSRGACLGEAPWSVISAAFGAFKPAVVEAAVTGGWAKTDPEPMLAARLEGAEAQLQRLLGDPNDQVDHATKLLSELTDGVDPSGRMLYSGLSVLPRPESPWGGFWRAADLVREHRGDGHIAAWIAHVDSTEITVLTELAWGIPPRSYVYTRGWNVTEVDAACERLTARGLLDDAGTALTPAGKELRGEIERETDRAERDIVGHLGDRAEELFGLLEPWSQAIVAGGGYPVDFSKLRGVKG
ncbi:MAG: SCO6745 family protein [Acidimicrobiia bacterium]